MGPEKVVIDALVFEIELLQRRQGKHKPRRRREIGKVAVGLDEAFVVDPAEIVSEGAEFTVPARVQLHQVLVELQPARRLTGLFVDAHLYIADVCLYGTGYRAAGACRHHRRRLAAKVCRTRYGRRAGRAGGERAARHGQAGVARHVGGRIVRVVCRAGLVSQVDDPILTRRKTQCPGNALELFGTQRTAVDRVGPEPVAFAISGVDAVGQKPIDDRSADGTHRAPLAVFGSLQCELPLQRVGGLSRDVVDCTGESIAAIERGLRAFHDLDALHIDEVGDHARRAAADGQILAGQINAVEHDRHAGPPAFRLNTAHGEARIVGKTAQIIGQARNQARDIVESGDPGALDFLFIDQPNGQWDLRCRFLYKAYRHGHVFKR